MKPELVDADIYREFKRHRKDAEVQKKLTELAQGISGLLKRCNWPRTTDLLYDEKYQEKHLPRLMVPHGCLPHLKLTEQQNSDYYFSAVLPPPYQHQKRRLIQATGALYNARTASPQVDLSSLSIKIYAYHQEAKPTTQRAIQDMVRPATVLNGLTGAFEALGTRGAPHMKLRCS